MIMIIIICQRGKAMPNPVFLPCEELRVLFQVWNIWQRRTGFWVNITYKGSPNVIVKVSKQRNKSSKEHENNFESYRILQAVSEVSLLLTLHPF